MEKWEYLRLYSWFKDESEYLHGKWVINYLGDEIPLRAALSELGDDGWELVGIQPDLIPHGGKEPTLGRASYFYIFKRPFAESQ